MIAFRTYAHFTFLFITGCLITLQRRCYFVCNGERGSVIVDLSAIDGQGPRITRVSSNVVSVRSGG